MSSLPVLIAEKRSQAKAYAAAFTVAKEHQGYIEIRPNTIFPVGAYITWGVGHLVELAEPKTYNPIWERWSLASLPILPTQFKHVITAGREQQFSIVKSLVQSAELVYNCCDCDREGSNIFYSICNEIGLEGKTVKRLWINSLEVDEVRKGFANLQDNRKDLLLYKEAKARQISDWLVGINSSRIFTVLLGDKGVNYGTYSVGRIQTPTVYLIYQRMLEIEHFVSKPFFEIEAQFTASLGIYKGKAKVKEDNKETVQSLLGRHNIQPHSSGVIQSLVHTEKRTPPPQLHSLSSLQATANRQWKVSPADVLKTVQTLYEKKLVTYPRTDTRHITPNEFAYLVERVNDYQQLIGITFPVHSFESKKRFVDSDRVQEHYAIVMTKNIPTVQEVAGLSEMERNLYEEIIRTTLGMFHTDYIYTETKVTTDVNGLPFYTIGKTEKDLGWKALIKHTEKETTDSDKEEPALPPLKEHEEVSSSIGIREGNTTAPKPYTEGQLITLMKNAGSKVQNKEESDILKETEGLGTEATRSNIIETIKNQGYIEVKKNIVSVTAKGRILCQVVEGSLLSSPSMTAKWETYLKKIGKGEGTVQHFLANISKFINQLVLDVPKQFETPHFNTVLAEAAKISTKKDDIAPCPMCKEGTIQKKKSFYGCSRYKDGCKMSFPEIFLKKKLSTTQINLLCTKGRTNVIKGFTSKADKKFDATLTLVEGKLQLEFLKN